MNIKGEDGYELWLRYRQSDDLGRMAQYRQAISRAVVVGIGKSAKIIRNELKRALPALLGKAVPLLEQMSGRHALVVGTVSELEAIGVNIPLAQRQYLGAEGFLITSHPPDENRRIVITSNSATALPTGTFHFLRLLQTYQDIFDLNIASRPRIRHRILSHWDNLDGSIERGYAGQSLWNWDELPETIDPR